MAHALKNTMMSVGIVVLPLLLLLLLVSTDWLSASRHVSKALSKPRVERTVESRVAPRHPAPVAAGDVDGTAVAPLPGPLELKSAQHASLASECTSALRQAAILLFGRISNRLNVMQSQFESLLKVRRCIERHVIAPNPAFNFTTVVRVEDPQDVPFAKQVFLYGSVNGSSESAMGGGVVFATVEFNRTIMEPSVFFCAYRMWSNIQVAVQHLRHLATTYLEQKTPCFTLDGREESQQHNAQLQPESVFEWVLMFRTEININTPFVLSRLNNSLFYLANMCVTSTKHKNRVTQTASKFKRISCLANETRPAVLWPLGKPLPPPATVGAPQCNHTLMCKQLINPGKLEAVAFMMPDYYFASNARTMSNMFLTIVDDWHAGMFRKAAGHCNHGLLGGRLIHKAGQVLVGRYKYHKVDVEIPRHASWYPAPSLVEYLANRGELWEGMPRGVASPDDRDAVLVTKSWLRSRCDATVCLVPGAEIFNV